MDPYSEIAVLYDLEHAKHQDDVTFYLNIVRQDPVLEVGVGTARIMDPLLQHGHTVWGIDPSTAMLARAGQRIGSHPRGHLVQCSIADLMLDVRFGTALLPLNFLWHLHCLDDRLTALRVIHRHLSPGGTLIVDLSNPLSLADRGANGEVRVRSTVDSGDRHIHTFSAAWDDEGEQTLTLALFYDEADPQGSIRRTASRLELRYLYRAEAELLLRLGGFDIDQIYGSYDLEPYSAISPNIIAVASAGT